MTASVLMSPDLNAERRLTQEADLGLAPEAKTREIPEGTANEPQGFAGEIAPLTSSLTIGVIVSTWPRLSQTFVLREILGLDRLASRLRSSPLKLPTPH